jgi:hypothetical protein
MLKKYEGKRRLGRATCKWQDTRKCIEGNI